MGYGQTASEVRATLAPPSEIHSSFCAVLSSRETGTQSEEQNRQTNSDGAAVLTGTTWTPAALLHFSSSALVVGSGTLGSYGGRRTVETDDRRMTEASGGEERACPYLQPQRWTSHLQGEQRAVREEPPSRCCFDVAQLLFDL